MYKTVLVGAYNNEQTAKEKFDKEVNELIEDGYEPYGSPSFTIEDRGDNDFVYYFSQAMMKK